MQQSERADPSTDPVSEGSLSLSRVPAESARAKSSASAPVARLDLRRARIIVLLTQLVSCAAFVAPFTRTNGFPLDDAWIHQVVARTFATTGTLGYRPGAFGAGATSYLWASLLAIGQALHANPVVFTDVFGVVSLLVSGQMLLELCRSSDSESARGTVGIAELAAVLLAAAGGESVWFAFSGMEATTVVAFTLAALVLASRTPLSTRAAVGAGALAGFAALTRPDFMPLGACVAVVVWARTRRVLPSAAVVAPWLFAVSAYFFANTVLAGTPMPGTLSGRRWLWLETAGISRGHVQEAFDLVFAWAYRLRSFTFGHSLNWPFWISVGLAVTGVWSAVRERRRGLVLLASWALLHFGIFLVMLPAPGHGGRYQPFVPVVYLIFVVLGAVELARSLISAIGLVRRASWREPVALAAGITPWAALLVHGWVDWRGAHADAVTHIRNTEVAMASAIRELPPSARIASFDIGAIGYFSDRPLLDLGALTDKRVAAALRHDALVDVLRADGITHVILPKSEDDFPDLANFGFLLHLQDNPALTMTPYRSFTGDQVSWANGIAYTQNAAKRQVLYEVGYTGCGVEGGSLPVATHGTPRVDVSGKSTLAREHRRLAYEQAATRGLCLRVSDEAAPAAGDDCWALHFDAKEPRLVGWPAKAAPFVPEARAIVDRWVTPYLEIGDLDGASSAALHALAFFTRAYLDPCFWSVVPPLGIPTAVDAPRPSTPLTAAWWGAPLALAVVLSSRVLSKRARAR
jgi:hypothetical protein